MPADSTPSYYYIDPARLPELESYLAERGFLSPDEHVTSADKAGEGNMNLTLRVRTEGGGRSFILKQARPWVEKYPQIPAPSERSLVELAFYDTVAGRPEVAAAMPRCVDSDPECRVILLEDLGEARDMTSLYADDALTPGELGELASYLSALHAPFSDLAPERRRALHNREMRSLNHTHIFDLPLMEENGLDLEAITPGLTDPARDLKRDSDYVGRVRRLGDVYLADGATLVHGDYFPGSWLRTDRGLRVIDPEFCFLGTPAFDLGVMVAHLYLSSQSETRVQALFEAYGDPGLETRARQFAGVEIMRRLIGVAQLPLTRTIDEKTALLDQSKRLVLTGELP